MNDAVRVLVVDDDDDVIFFIKEILEPQGFSVSSATSSDAALLRLLGEPWDVVLVDFNIDRRDGLQLIREARAGGFVGPVLMFTGSARADTLAPRALEEGLTQFIEKRNLNVPPLSRTIRWAIDHDRTIQALARANTDLARKNQDLERFAGVVGHDLRGPMHRIATTLELLELRFSAELSDDGSAMIGRTIHAVTELGRLVDDLLAYARLNDVKFGEAHIDVCLGRAMESQEDVIIERGARIEHGTLGTIRGSRTHLTQLLQNLIANALKFSPQDNPVVRVRSSSDGAYFILEVEDEGIGIAPGDQTEIFEMFHRVHTDTEFPGTGIGLATCAKIAEMHGGRIEVSSALGEGSTFRVFLALAPPETPAPGAWAPSN